MLKILLLTFLLLTSVCAFAQQEENNSETPKLKQYYFVMLVKGPHRDDIDSLSLVKIQEGHMANINKMAESGKLQIAGPFGDDGNWRGIFIFDVATEEEVRELLKDDPAIQAGRLAYEIHPWWTMPGGCLK
ncbi:MAG: hypothetical protein IPM14_00695 [bacterium]|nr:hypothetical protein [bacterium]